MQLFKYCKSMHMQFALEKGSIRIGTLLGYRNTKKFGEMTSDENEGIKLMGGVITNLTSGNKDLYPALAGLIKVEGSGSIGRIEIGEARIHSPNFLIFSTSSEYSEDVHRMWLKEEEYDACYTITSSEHFFKAISDAIGPHYTFQGIHHVTYADKLDIATREAGLHPAVVKQKTKYTDQSEVRAIWALSDGEEIEHLTPEQTSAHLYAKAYRVLPNEA